MDIVDEGNPKIQQRNKGLPLSITNSFPSTNENIQLKITAYPNSWKDLQRYLKNCGPDFKENLGEIIYGRFIYPSLKRLSSHPGRGMHKSTEELVAQFKERAAYTYALSEYWLKQPQYKWPRKIKNIVKEMAELLMFKEGEKPPTPTLITAYIMEKKFENDVKKLREKHKRKDKETTLWTDDPDNFKKTYINKNVRVTYYGNVLRKLSEKLNGLPSGLAIAVKDPSPIVLLLDLLKP
jgi:hypothetical protein